MERRYGGMCRSGEHELTEANTYIAPSGKWCCILCKHRRKNDNQLSRLYGINSVEERDALLAAQGGACAACGRTDCTWGKGWLNVWHIDHKHGVKGTHRGILCARCNVVVGLLETANVTIQKCRDYLAKW